LSSHHVGDWAAALLAPQSPPIGARHRGRRHQKIEVVERIRPKPRMCIRDRERRNPRPRAKAAENLEHDEIWFDRYRAPASCLSMISAQTRSGFVATENRCTLFRIMLWAKR
jgi:hypothetical protein